MIEQPKQTKNIHFSKFPIIINGKEKYEQEIIWAGCGTFYVCSHNCNLICKVYPHLIFDTFEFFTFSAILQLIRSVEIEI